MKNRLEKEYYPIVQKWLQKTKKCFVAEINIGLENSRADIAGVKDVGGDFSGEIETTIVEVKRGAEAFTTSIGQADGYSIYSNRVYLADHRSNGYSEDEIHIASHLGVGLIQINDSDKCFEILSSPYYKPLTKFNMHFLFKLGLAKCQFCETYFSTKKKDSVNKNITRSENIQKAIDENKGIVFWNRELNISGRIKPLFLQLYKANSSNISFTKLILE